MTHSCILWLYHRDDDVTREHLWRCRYFNPDIAVVPLTFGAHTAPWRNEEANHILDLGFRWFASDRRIEADRYFFFEWDTLLRESVKVFYRSCWDDPVAVPQIFTPKSYPGWSHFPPVMTFDLYPLGVQGFSPHCGIMLTRDVMKACSERYQEKRFATLHGECAAGCMVLDAGFPSVEIFPKAHHFISCAPVATDREAGIWHPIKT